MEGGFAGTTRKKTDKTGVLQAISRKRLVAGVFSAISSMLLLPFPFIHIYLFLSQSMIEALQSVLMLNLTSSGVVLEKVCEYLYFNEKSKEQKDVQDMDFPPELCLELLMAADFLQSESACCSMFLR